MAFEGPIGLSSITIPNSAAVISSNAFDDTSASLIVYFCGPFNSNTFPGHLICPPPPPPPLQTDALATSMAGSSSSSTPATLTGSAGSLFTISGSFHRTVVAIYVGSIRLQSFTQTPTGISFILPANASGSYPITIYNGAAPLLSASVTYPAPISLAPPPVVKKLVIDQCTKKNRHSYKPTGTHCANGYTPIYQE